MIHTVRILVGIVFKHLQTLKSDGYVCLRNSRKFWPCLDVDPRRFWSFFGPLMISLVWMTLVHQFFWRRCVLVNLVPDFDKFKLWDSPHAQTYAAKRLHPLYVRVWMILPQCLSEMFHAGATVALCCYNHACPPCSHWSRVAGKIAVVFRGIWFQCFGLVQFRSMPVMASLLRSEFHVSLCFTLNSPKATSYNIHFHFDFAKVTLLSTNFILQVWLIIYYCMVCICLLFDACANNILT